MGTRAKLYTRAVYPAVRAVRPSAVLSGIVPDFAHLTDGGYHVSIDDLRRYGNSGDYSNRATLDKAPPVTLAGRGNACAIDISMNPADSKATYKAVDQVWRNRTTDTRAKYLNAINVWDGVATHHPQRFNFQTGTKTRASADHRHHLHGDWPRVYVDDGYNAAAAARAARAMASAITGQTHDQWQRQEQLGPYAPGADMTKKELLEFLQSAEGKAAVAAAAGKGVHDQKVGKGPETMGVAIDRILARVESIDKRLTAISPPAEPGTEPVDPPTT